MIAMESEGSINFASATRKIDGSFDLNEPDRDIVNSPSCSNNTYTIAETASNGRILR